MWNLLWFRLCLCLCISLSHVDTKTVSKKTKSFDGFKVVSVEALEDQIKLIDKLKSTFPVDEWSVIPVKPKNKKSKKWTLKTDFMVSPKDLAVVLKFLKSNKMKHSIKIQDVGSLVNKNTKKSVSYQMKRKQMRGIKPIDWNDFYKPEDIFTWLNEIVNSFPKLAKLTIVGNTTQGRPIPLVTISKNSSDVNKRSILIDGCIHAREWMSPAITTWIIDNLLQKPDDELNKKVLDAFNVYVIPLVNIDGYAFSHTDDRLWRKTLSFDKSSRGCIGVDLNRNFEFHFGGGGTSGDKCSEIYRGPEAFSERESWAIRDVINGNKENWLAYFTIHSYGHTWLNPWSWTTNKPDDVDEHLAFAKAGVDAMRTVRGSTFEYGPSSRLYGLTAGSSDDWAYGVANIKYSQTLEMDKGHNGFLASPEDIIPSAKEAWAGIAASCLSVI